MMWRIKNRKKEKKRKLNLIIRFTHTHTYIYTDTCYFLTSHETFHSTAMYLYKSCMNKKWQHKKERAKKR